MHHQRVLKKHIALLLAVMLICTYGVFADDENTNSSGISSYDSLDLALSPVDFSSLYKLSLERFYAKQIETAYQALLKTTNREDFRGYCAMYVNNLLVYFGINSSYIKGNANLLYSLYSAKSYTDNGFFVEDYSAKNYSLKDALSLFTDSDTPEERILVIFSKGATEKGKEFGHVFYVNAILGDKVIFSESSPSIFTDRVVQDGKPLILTVDEVCEKYAYYKFEGVIQFTSFSEPSSFIHHLRERDCRYLLPLSTHGRI